MPPKKERQRRHRDKEPEPEGPVRPFAQKHFGTAVRPPDLPRPRPEEDEEVMHSAEVLDVDPAFLPELPRKNLGLPMAPKLPPALQEAVEAAGDRKSRARIKRAVNAEQEKEYIQQTQHSYPAIGSVQLDEQMLRRVFQKMDLDANEQVTARILKHFFHQMGEMVDSAEIDAMIAMVDAKECGAASYEDFAAIFSNPAEALRTVNVQAVKNAYSSQDTKTMLQEAGIEAGDMEEDSDDGDESD
eukprot:CAMPEP_0197658704 /NCGR_PEP_ID=MMETSP1338-20131121/45395_1 /TAXON_ID=43686 ORGANISM="Pelagodinium beii, Strain RCC1491" /NCGR_SAMPLE_ID=MMETSP1338 /ASSEMBLY_ACC=CAM_ASM_000754 /LENGTH=242 /DNA_ID=CAMNT_0043235337 /DNA_START=57 /DNA_END=785 /DNA_ORIENTATION=-